MARTIELLVHTISASQKMWTSSHAFYEKFPHRRIYLSGFSLGGNVALKFLGEQGAKARERNLFGAVTMSVPFDLVQSGAKIDKGINRLLYAKKFPLYPKTKGRAPTQVIPGRV